MLEFALCIEGESGAGAIIPILSFSVSFTPRDCADPGSPVGVPEFGCRLSLTRTADGGSLRLVELCTERACVSRLSLVGTLASQPGAPAVYRLDLYEVRLAEHEHSALSGEQHVMEQITLLASSTKVVHLP